MKKELLAIIGFGIIVTIYTIAVLVIAGLTMLGGYTLGLAIAAQLHLGGIDALAAVSFCTAVGVLVAMTFTRMMFGTPEIRITKRGW